MRLGIAGISFRKPDRSLVERDERRAKGSRPNHRHKCLTEVMRNGTRNPYQSGWNVDYDCVQIGKGKQAYDEAKDFVRDWRHMELEWVDTNRPPVEVGSVVIVMARVLGLLWMRNPLAIVHHKEQQGVVPARAVDSGRQQPQSFKKGKRLDFGQTTLEGHSLAGEERFSVQWCTEDDTVWYEIYAISRPATLLAFASYPLTRHYQRRFRRESMKAVHAAVAKANSAQSIQ